MVPATGLSMAETLTVATMRNAVDSPPKELVKHAPAQQPQKGRELEQQRERRELEFDDAHARGAARRTSKLIQTMEKGRASPERREIGTQAHLRARSTISHPSSIAKMCE